MAKSIHLLTALQVKQLSKSGRYTDGQGLYLQVVNREVNPGSIAMK